jgi:hypothetical protein
MLWPLQVFAALFGVASGYWEWFQCVKDSIRNVTLSTTSRHPGQQCLQKAIHALNMGFRVIVAHPQCAAGSAGSNAPESIDMEKISPLSSNVFIPLNRRKGELVQMLFYSKVA